MADSTIPPLHTATVRRRLGAMLYDALLLLSVQFLAIAVFLMATPARQSATYDHALRFFLFLVAAAYFIHFWRDSGHTLAMKTWRIKLIKPGHAVLPLRVAALRFLLAWAWFLPGLVACYALHLPAKRDVAGIAVVMLANIGLWALTAFLDRDRQFLHDKLLGTRLVQLPKPPRPARAA